MLILSDRKKRIRSLLFVAVLGLALVVGFCLIKTKEAAVDALTSAGERVDVERQKKADGYTYNIYYSSDTAATVRFYVTNQSGQRSIGFCRNPDMRGPDYQSNPLYAKVFAVNEVSNIAKLMAYLVTEDNSVATEASNSVFATSNGMSPGGKSLSDADVRYGFAHAVIGYAFGSSNTHELLDIDRPFVETLKSRVKNLIDSDSNVWVLAKNYRLYGLDGYPRAATAAEIAADPDAIDGYQDVVWIESVDPPKGTLKVKKCMKGDGDECKDAQPGTDFNNIKFEVYNDTGAKIYYNNTFYENGAKVTDGTLTNGNTELPFYNLPVGRYRIKEVIEEGNGNTWYDVDVNQEKTGTVVEGPPVTVYFYNRIKTGGLIVYKKDKETNNCSTLGKADFAGNKFEVRDSSDTVVATKTMAKGDCSVSFTGLPYGDYTVKEITAGNGYLRDTSTKTVIVPPTGGGNAEATFSNQVMRGDVMFKKVDENNQPMANIPFKIRSKTTQEEHIVVTNSNGVVNTAASFIPHTTSTNGYDSLNINTITYRGFGAWFNGSKTITTTVDNSLGALPYDDYEVFELECNHNQICRDIASRKEEFTISSDKQLVDLETFNNDCGASVSTSATDNKDGDKFVEADAAAKIKDTVTYQAKPGLTLTIKGKLMDKSTGQPLNIGGQEITATQDVIVPENGSGTATLIFSLDASTIAGRDIVVYEELYFGSELIAEHKNINDVNQTVTIVKITTSASDNADNDKFVEANATAKIKDHVSYCAKAGDSVKIMGKLMNKATGQPLKIGSQEVTAEKTVTVPASGCGEADLIFSLDASTIAGKDIVVYEELYKGTSKITEHKDLNDANQTVTIISLSTIATDDLDEDKYIEAAKGQKVRDVVNYCVKPGQDFTIKGVLMDKSTGKELLIDGHKFEQEVVVNSDEGCGSVTLVFPLDATLIAGIDVVAFEYLYYGDKLILSHNYFDDVEQTTSMISLFTYATNEKGDDKTIVTDKKSIIKDKIKYALKLGSKYTIKGVLVDKETGKPILVDGKKVERFIEVDTAKSATGETEMIYEFDSTGLDGKEIVIFDEIYDADGVLILSHTDINNANQTVKFVAPAPETGVMTTLFGNGAVANSVRLGGVMGGALVVFYLSRRYRARRVKVSW